MAISLPPPIPPQLGSAVELRAASLEQDALQIEYRGNHIHVFGSRLIKPERLRKAVDAAANLSDAIRAIGYVYYVDGFPATLISYAAAGEYDFDIYVRVVTGRLREVTGPPALLPYFSDLNHRTPLTGAALEADRALADGLAARAGTQYQPQFKPVGGDEVVLDLGNALPGERQTALAASFSNYGNRYAGPYLATAGMRQAFSSGDELTLSATGGVRLLGLGGTHSQPYHQGDGGWSRVTRFGVFGLQGQYADFREAVPGFRFNGNLSAVGASWLYPLYADFQQRLNLQGKLERNHVVIDQPSTLTPAGCALLGDLLKTLGLANCPAQGSGEALSELYNSAELALSYVTRVQHEDRQVEMQAGLVVRKGLGPAHSAGTTADLGYFLWRPSVTIRYGLTPHWTLLGDGSAQFSNGGSVPHQQQFVVGGPATAHAYVAGAGIGDHGESLRLGVEWKDYDDSWLEHHGIRPRGFVEYGSATHERRAPTQPSGSVAIADAGAAVDIRLTSWLGSSLSVAQSIYRHGGENSPNGLERRYVYFQLAAKY